MTKKTGKKKFSVGDGILDNKPEGFGGGLACGDTGPTKLERVIPEKWGICMEGCEAELGGVIHDQIDRMVQSGRHSYSYLEIGVAEGHTLAAMTRLLYSRKDLKKRMIVGLDIPEGWSLNQASIETLVGGELTAAGQEKLLVIDEEKFFKIYLGMAIGHALMTALILCPSHRFLTNYDGVGYDFVFIDGCHGKACVMGDFIHASSKVKVGGLVCFHDATENCQGHHFQPHCGTGIAVRSALQDLGLLDNKLAGWRLHKEIPGDNTRGGHGCVVVERVEC